MTSETERSSLYHSEQYWLELSQLKAAAECIRLYRNRLGRLVRGIELVRALASSGSIAAWAIWKDYPLLWGGIIAAAQVVDATKNVFRLARLHRSACDLTVALDLLFIDAQLEWDKIYSGKIRTPVIMDRCAKLRRLRAEAERKHFPEGFNPSLRQVDLAAEEARSYLSRTYT